MRTNKLIKADMRNVCGEMGSFGEYTHIAVCTHWAKDSWYSGDARDAGVLKDLTLCSVNSRKSSYGNYATARLWSWRAFPKTFSRVNIALYSVPFSKSLLIKTKRRQHLKCAKYAVIPSSWARFRFVGQSGSFFYKWMQKMQKVDYGR